MEGDPWLRVQINTPYRNTFFSGIFLVRDCKVAAWWTDANGQPVQRVVCPAEFMPVAGCSKGTKWRGAIKLLPEDGGGPVFDRLQQQWPADYQQGKKFPASRRG